MRLEGVGQAHRLLLKQHEAVQAAAASGHLDRVAAKSKKGGTGNRLLLQQQEAVQPTAASGHLKWSGGAGAGRGIGFVSSGEKRQRRLAIGRLGGALPEVQ